MKKFIACDPKAYKHNLSLFISSLTKQVLVEPFHKAPLDATSTWQDFSKEYTTDDINRAVKDRLYGAANKPPYKIEISQDLYEYVAFQEIPFFGAHFYYAFSPNEKINEWQKFSKLKIPKKYVEALELSYHVESPIKGRVSGRPKATKAAAKEHRQQKRTKVSAKPQWEGPEEEEPEPVEEATKKTTTILIPTGGPVQAIPAALQRRMAEAENKSKKDFNIA